MRRSVFGILLTGFLFPALLFAQAPKPGKNNLAIRGEQQEVYFYPAPANSKQPPPKVLFAPGDGGWRGFAVTMAETTAASGYNVYGIDTKHYLESFTGKTTLKATEVTSDFRQIAAWITQGKNERVTLVGWSEGAGLCLLAAAGEDNQKSFSGLITIGLSKFSVLGWRWRDDITYLTRKTPDEPQFQSVDFLAKVAPLPLLMIQASQDEYVAVDTARQMFAMAREPKRFSLIEAQNHRFDGNRKDFFRILREGLQWINQPLN